MAGIRPYRPGDEPELASICLLTAAAGGDATGLLEDDELWAELFVLPYVSFAPEFALVVEGEGGRVGGYAVAVGDTLAFERWFRETWWPPRAVRWPEPAVELTAQDGLLRYAYGRGVEPSRWADRHPAHLHIDLLPELQRQGWGRRLIEALIDRLRAAGVAGLHIEALAENAGALAFYERLRFIELERGPDSVVFGIEL